MPEFAISLHALEQLSARGISEDIVFNVLENPDNIEEESEGQLIYQKIITFENKKDYLVRVFVNPDKTPKLVKTVYKTSKFNKY